MLPEFELKQEGLPLVFFRSLYVSTVAITVLANIFLLSHGMSAWSAYLLIAASVIMSILGKKVFSKLEGSVELKQVYDNAKEARRLILDAENNAFPFLARRNTARLNNFSFSDALEEPLNWVLSVFIFWIFFTTDTYTQFDFNDPEKLVLLIFMSLLQLMSLSIAILGIVTVVYKKIKGKKS